SLSSTALAPSTSSHLPLLLLFLFNQPPPPQPLPSSPTRRSSDLHPHAAARRDRRDPAIARAAATASGDRADHVRRRRARPASARSEEHTSELQSLTNLVCRLLLEKKKEVRARDSPHSKCVTAQYR